MAGIRFGGDPGRAYGVPHEEAPDPTRYPDNQPQPGAVKKAPAQADPSRIQLPAGSKKVLVGNVEHKLVAVNKKDRANFWQRHPIAIAGLSAASLVALAVAGGVLAGKEGEQWGVQHNFTPATYPNYTGATNASSGLPI